MLVTTRWSHHAGKRHADGAGHLEDAEAFPRPMLYVALGAPAWMPRAAAGWASARSPALCGLISETVGVRTYVLAMEIVGVQRLREWSLLDAGCRAPSVATTGSGPLPPAGCAPTSTLRPRPRQARRSPVRDQLGAPRVKDRQQDRGHLLTDHAHGHVVAAHRGRDVCHLLCPHRRPRVGQQSTNLAATAPPTFAAHRRSRLGRRGRRHRPTMSGGHQRRHHTAGYRCRFPMWTVMAQRWYRGSVRD